MGFDAGEVMREVDAQRALRESLHVASVSNVRRHYQKIARDLSGLDRLQQSIVGSAAPANDHAWIAEMGRKVAQASLPGIRDTFRASHVLDGTVRRMLPELNRNIADWSYHALRQNDVVRRTRMLAYSSLSSSIAQALEAQGLTSAHTAAWNLRRVQSFRTPALQSLLKSITTFGPIVVSPGYEDDAPFDYHPNLQGWLIPETATESGEAIDVEELWTAVGAWAQGIAVNHRTEALLRVIGTDGRSFLVQVAGTVVGGLILYWILPH